MANKCGDTRPGDRDGEKINKKKIWKLEELAADMPVVITVFPGCIEGDRVTYNANGPDRAVLLNGTVEQVARYTVGEKVTVKGQEYQRNVGRKQVEAVERIKMEMYGTGAVDDLVKKAGAGAKHNGFTIQVNKERVTGESLLNSYLTEITFVKGDDGKPVPKSSAEVEQNGKYTIIFKPGTEIPAKAIGGIEMTVTAIIVSGSDYNPNRVEYKN